jgi:hypothetical protein
MLQIQQFLSSAHATLRGARIFSSRAELRSKGARHAAAASNLDNINNACTVISATRRREISRRAPSDGLHNVDRRLHRTVIDGDFRVNAIETMNQAKGTRSRGRSLKGGLGWHLVCKRPITGIFQNKDGH